MREVEILAPAGSLCAMKAAFNAGADAVYIGGSEYGARAYADNPDSEELLRAIDYAHLHHKKLYLTVNTLLRNNEIYEGLLPYIAPLYAEGLDAVLVQDMGVISLLREYFPELPLHASTQMTVCGASYAEWLKEKGICRAVLPRELSIGEIRRMCSETGMEIEVFVHGALCYCYSGQCLMSSMIGGRSGNRGRCAQPCRLRYSYCADGGKSSGYLLSPKDLCGLDALPELIDAGVCSLKIEGRMKSPEYAALTSSIYRRYADMYLEHGAGGYHIAETDRSALLDIYNRGGFTGGYFHSHNGQDMMSTRTPGNAGSYVGDASSGGRGHVLLHLKKDIMPGDILQLPDGSSFKAERAARRGDELPLPCRTDGRKGASPVMRTRNEQLMQSLRDAFISGRDIKEKINGFVNISKDMPVTMNADCVGYSVCCSGATAGEARKHPLDEQEVRKRITKSGQTPFCFEKLDIRMDSDVFLTVSELNEIRRDTLDKLEKKILEGYRRPLPDMADVHGRYQPASDRKQTSAGPALAALISREEQLDAVLSFSDIDMIYLEDVYFSEDAMVRAAAKVHGAGRSLWIAMPHVMRMDREGYFLARAALYRSLGADGFLARNMESCLFLRSQGFRQPVAGDYGMYCMNDISSAVYSQVLDRITVSPELNRRELAHLGALAGNEIIVYGRQPLMISAQCLEKTSASCSHRGGLHMLTDRYRLNFPVSSICSLCYNVIYNSVPLYLPEVRDDLPAGKGGPAVLRLQFLDESQEQTEKVAGRFAGLSHSDTDPETFTRGHYNRGVE